MNANNHLSAARYLRLFSANFALAFLFTTTAAAETAGAVAVVRETPASISLQISIGSDGNAPFSRWILIPPEGGVSLSVENPVVRELDRADGSTGSREEFYRLGEPAVMRGYRMIPLFVSPEIIDPKDGKAKLLERATVTLDFNSLERRDNPVADPLRPRSSRSVRKLIEELVVNPPLFSRDDGIEDGSILYVLGDWNEVEDALEPLIVWRRRMGWKVATLRVDDNDDRVAIKSAIQDFYDNADVPPEHIVLVGDAPGMRNNRYTLAFYDVRNGAQWAYETDQPYTFLEGNDLLPEASIGRFPFNNISLLEGMVAKTVAYESDPYVGGGENDRGWQRRAIVAATDARSGRSSIDVCNWFIDLTRSHGFTRINNLYFTANDQEVNPGDFIHTNFASGVSFFLYRGWSDMNGYSADMPRQLRNGEKLPFVMLATCNTGEYAAGNQASAWSYTERFVNNSAGGAIGAVGAAGATHTAYNNLLAAGTLAAPFVREIRSQGWALADGETGADESLSGLWGCDARGELEPRSVADRILHLQPDGRSGG